VIGFFVHRYVVLSFIATALVLSGAAIIVISFNHSRISGFRYAATSLVLALFFTLFASHGLAGFIYKVRYAGKNQLTKLSWAIKDYVENNDGYLPDANQWCDSLRKSDRSLSKYYFERPLIDGYECNFAFNINLSSMRLADVPDNVVLLFEADGQWNLTGGPELLKQRNDLDVYLLLANGTICRCDFGSAGTCVCDYKSKKTKEISISWKP
jgi:hypothetical protein